MEQPDWGYVQLGTFALLLGGLKVWWISTVLRRQDRSGPLRESEFRRALERIWQKDQQAG